MTDSEFNEIVAAARSRFEASLTDLDFHSLPVAARIKILTKVYLYRMYMEPITPREHSQ